MNVANWDLSGKVALVTGSSRGLGRNHALHLARAGADVIIHDVNAAAAAQFGEAASGEAAADEIRALGRRSAFLAANLTDPDQVEKFVQQAISQFGHIDILVNNAGGDIGAHTPRPENNNAIDIKVEDIQALLNLNLLNVMLMCKYVGHHMRERRSGKIINVGSSAGHIATTVGIIYAAAKAGISHYTLCLGEQLRPFDVNVNCIAPAATKTGRFKATRFAGELADQEGLSRLQRVADPDDMSKIVLFLAGSASDYLSGETIVCR